ncbi:MAG: TetR/AcrR family transcriptional regulator [Bdellovibrionota bacterium]
MARPRQFDRDEILGKVTQLFWQKGFAQTSLADIEKATGLKKGSIYLCFGSKQKLFQMALAQYSSQGPFLVSDESRVMDALVAFYQKLLDEADLPSHKRKGCFVFNSCLEFSARPSPLRAQALESARQAECFFQNLIMKAQDRGEISAVPNSQEAGSRIFASIFTIREMVKFKADKSFLAAVANTALASVGSSKRIEAA